MKKIFVTILFLYNSNLFAQKDYNNSALQAKQWVTVKKVLRFIELNQSDSIWKFVDSSFLKNNPKISMEVQKASKTVSKVYKKCLPPEGPINYVEGFNIYKCSYRKLPTTYAQFEIYMKEGEPNSKVMKIVVKETTKVQQKKDDELPPDIHPSNR